MSRSFRALITAVALLVLAGGLALVTLNDEDDTNRGVSAGNRATTTSTSLPVDPESVPPSVTAAPRPPSSPRVTAAAGPRITATPTTRTPTTIPDPCPRPARGSDFDGFGATEIVIENASGAYRSCVLTADSPQQQQQGLMRQDDLDGYGGMIFRFASEEPRTFWMRNTRIPLSIAFYDAAGRFVSSTDMEPCGDSEDCPRYTSNGPAKYALEVSKGRLPELGATSGSRLVG